MIRDLDPELLAYILMGAVEFAAIRLGFDDKYSFEQAITIHPARARIPERTFRTEW